MFTVYTEDISRDVQIDQAIGFRGLAEKRKKKHLQEAANVEQKIIYIQILRENSMGDFSYFQIMRTVEVKQAKGYNVFCCCCCCCCAAAFANRLVRRSVVNILQSKREKRERRQHACAIHNLCNVTQTSRWINNNMQQKLQVDLDLFDYFATVAASARSFGYIVYIVVCRLCRIRLL